LNIQSLAGMTNSNHRQILIGQAPGSERAFYNRYQATDKGTTWVENGGLIYPLHAQALKILCDLLVS